LAAMRDEEIFRLGADGWRAEFEKLFGRLRRQPGVPPDRLLAIALDESGYCAGLSERALANIEKFLSYLRREHRYTPLAEVLEDVEALRTTQSEAEAPPSDAGNVVRLMSMHAAKGLEFRVVFVSALHRRPDLRKPVIAFSRSVGLGVKWRNPATGKSQPDSAHAAIIDEMKRREEEEENRLLYVAMTRAADRLILSHAETTRPTAWLKLINDAIPVTRAKAGPLDPPRESPFVGIDGAEPLILKRPVVTGQYDSSVSVSALATFYNCSQRYYLSSQRKPEYDDRAISTGLGVHSILAGAAEGSAEEAALAARF